MYYLILSYRLIEVLQKCNHQYSELLLNLNENFSDKISYVDYHNANSISYLSKDRYEKEGHTDKWNSKYRQTMSIGKFVRYILIKSGTTVIDSEIEKIVNHYKSFNAEYKFTIVKGHDIPFYYNTKRYEKSIINKGNSLYNSCMREVSSSYFNIYVKNDISLLCMFNKDSDLLIGRALLWNNIQINGEIGCFLDRIYTINEYLEIPFKEYCQKRGYFYKKFQGSGNTAITNGIVTIEEPNLIFKLNNKYDWINFNLPYLDTIPFLGYTDNNGISEQILTSIQNTNYKYILRSTQGRYKYNDRYTERKDIFLKRIMHEEIHMIKYDNGYAWVSDLESDRLFNIKLVRDGNELVTIRGFRKKGKNITNDANISVNVAENFSMYIFDILNDESIFIKDKEYKYLSNTYINIDLLNEYDFIKVMNDYPEIIYKTNIPNNKISIVENNFVELIMKMPLKLFIQNSFSKEIIKKYLEKNNSDIIYHNDKIKIKLNKDKIKKIVEKTSLSISDDNSYTILGVRDPIEYEDYILSDINISWLNDDIIPKNSIVDVPVKYLKRNILTILKDAFKYKKFERKNVLESHIAYTTLYYYASISVKVTNLKNALYHNDLKIVKRSIEECAYLYIEKLILPPEEPKERSYVLNNYYRF